jgi:CBS domain-containing protein
MRTFKARRTNAFVWVPAALAAASAAAGAGLWWRRHNAPPSGRLVGDVMIRDVLMIDADATLSDAAQLMRDGNVGVLPVVEHGRLRGIITDRDLVVRAMADGAVPTMTHVGECATWDIVCARPESPIEEAMEVMADSQIGRLPVVDTDNKVIGIVTLSSLALRSPRQGEALETAQEVSKRSTRAA